MEMLDRLYAANRISLDVYVEKKGMVQAKYHHEVEANELLSNLLKENVHKVSQISQKLEKDR